MSGFFDFSVLGYVMFPLRYNLSMMSITRDK